MLDVVRLHLVEHFHRVGQRFGQIGEHFVHFFARLEPLLLCVEHACGVVEVLARAQAEQVVVRLGVFLVHEVAVVRAHQLHAVLPGQFDEHAVGLLLLGKRFAVGPDRGVLHLVAHQFHVVVVAEDALVPQQCLFGSGHVALQDFARQLARQAGRAADDALVEALNVVVVRTRTHVVTVHPCAADNLHQVLVACLVLCQQDEVVARQVAVLLYLAFFLSVCHVYFAAEDGLEGFLAGFLELAVLLVAHIEELLDAEHVAVVGHGHAFHAVADGLVHQLLDAGLSVKNRIIGVYVQMYEVFHFSCRFVYAKINQKD